jgi:hypothetical protein
MTALQIRALFTALFLLAGGCSSSAVSPVDAGGLTDAATGPILAAMNDVSILFPLPSSAPDVDNLLAASARGAQGTLLPSALYASVGPIAGSTMMKTDGGGIFFSAIYADLHVVAMRIDPCFASLAPDPHGVGCAAQLRLVVQEVRAGATGGASTFDSALHLFYSLTRPQLLTLARALVALRVANADDVTLGPLAPHPIMVRQGLDGAFSKGVRQLILQYAGENNLVRVAQLDIVDGILAWNLAANDVTNAATATTTPFQIPTLPAGITTDSLTTGATLTPFSVMLITTTTSADNFIALDDGKAASLSAATRQSAFDALVRVENPTLNSANTIDCALCHLATPTEQLVAFPDFALDDRAGPFAFLPDGKSVNAADLVPTFNTSGGRLDMHAFSYVGQDASINQRVVNETAAVVEYLNGVTD